ncbi:MAG: S41 family peptidase [Bacteroidia bacterium]|nr:S41 family peptidase [Bacteroidia bacterium]NNM15295.1 S41 family peptidase [Bacteroidia bacterium]
MKKSIKILFLSLAIISAGFVSQSFKEDYFEITRNLDIFTTLFRELNIHYVDDTNPGELMKTGIDAMLTSLDPYTNYIPESNIEDYRFMTTGQYGGIGALIGKNGSDIIVTDPYEGFAAHKAGLMAGDKLIEVDGKSTEGKSISDVSQILKGQPNTTVKIKIERPGTAGILEKEIERQEIKVKSIPYSGMIADGIGYVKLRSFTQNCGKEIKVALEELKTNNDLKSIVLDLRGNPGGLLHEAVNITNLFVDKGSDVVSTKGKLSEMDKTYKALNAPFDKSLPVVVLVNSSSASASEIVSGAIQDFDRGLVIGQKTFGKGLVQTTRPLSYNSQLKITTAKYYIPSGRCIQALDYSNRNDDGSVGSIPDSLKSQFKTSGGRVVYDGGGIEPDYATDKTKYSKITQSLLSKYLIFDYATQYRLKHETIEKANEFKLTDEDFNSFVNFLSDKTYDYTTQSEKAIEELKKLTMKDKYYEGLKTEYEALKNKIYHNKQEDLKTNKKEIMLLLQNEIVSRYYFEKGRIESSFVDDKDVKMAISALKDKDIYTSIFKRDYNPSN